MQKKPCPRYICVSLWIYKYKDIEYIFSTFIKLFIIVPGFKMDLTHKMIINNSLL